MTRLEVLQTELSALELYLPYADGQAYYRDRDRIDELKREIYVLKLKEDISKCELRDAD